MNPFYLICLIWITLCASVLAKDSPADAVRKRFAEQAFAAGKLQPAPQAKLEIILEKSTWEIGEPIWAKLKVSSTGKEFTIDQGGDYRPCGYPRRCKVVATDPEGKIMPDHGFDLQMGGIGGSETITQSEPCTFEFPILDTVNFTVPGEYQIYVSHDLGWKITNTHPVVSTKIKLIEPTTESATKRVKDLLSKINNTGRDSQSRVIDIEDQRSSHRAKKDIKWLRHPSYLPELRRAVEKEENAAITAISGINSRPAMQYLIDLCWSKNPEIAMAAASEIALHGGSDWDLDYEFWDPTLTAAAIKAAEQFLLQIDIPEKVRAGCEIIQRHGGPKDMPSVLVALEYYLDRPEEESLHLIRAVRQLINRGYQTKNWTTDTNKAAGFIEVREAWYQQYLLKQAKALHQKKFIVKPTQPLIPMPADKGWKQALLSITPANPVGVRRLAVEAIPPNDSDFDELLIRTLADKDEAVAISACHKISNTKNKKFIRYLERITDYTDNPEVIEAATEAAKYLLSQ